MLTVLGDTPTLLGNRLVLPASGPAFHVWRLEGSGGNATAIVQMSTQSRMENGRG
jgi:hypothetical protein